ncbi:Ig-like domain-containing protein [Corallococcus sp. Z5C101001]|uniref:Ig-like domain-containing protein n=1 Tax=Corallococcus sp. Z5C101001 TaxID=2596829 RepID=UPI00117FEA87|nr:Ig-like domain-containing protein [Corallococcus sp. Z5C101001]TSC25207.1 hypothetical protein FOF48_25065 [Corallococcus sp. Z5C101001]
MHGHAWTWSAVGMFLLGMSTLIPTSAHACVAPNCMVGVRFPLPEDGGAVPANVPGLVTAPPLLENVDPATVRLLLPDGTPVPATVTTGAYQAQVLIPDAPLEPGTTYRLEAKGVCQFQQTELESTTFTAGPALPLPTTLGTLTVDEPSQGIFTMYGDSNCGNTRVSGDSTLLRFQPSRELAPFLPWMHWTVEVDGQPWASVKHSGVTSLGENNVESYLYQYNRRLFFLYTVCGYTSCADSYHQPPTNGLAPGRHRATLQGTLEHADLTLPPLSVDFELTCPQKIAGAGVSLGGCSDGGYEWGGLDGGVDGGSTAPNDPPPEPETSKKGCSQTGGGLTLLGLLATLRLLRRSRQDRP